MASIPTSRPRPDDWPDEPAREWADKPADEPADEVPDPRFWGPEPRTLRRPGRPARRTDRSAPRGAITDRFEALRERCSGTRIELGVGVLAVALVALLAGVVWYRMGAGGGGTPPPAPTHTAPAGRAAAAPATPRVTASATPPPGSRAAGAGGSAARGAAVMVHVAGAVRTPGVLELPAGARVIDAVEGAGGALPDADLDRLNLAAKLVDGQRVLVVKVGAPSPPVDTGNAAAADPGAGPIDLNSATAAQLDALPGIGPALAQAIVAERDRRGGFRSVNELREVRGIGDRRFADLRDRVSV